MCLSFATFAAGQTLVLLPENSQRATVSQRLGVTDITITYHRPLVGGRKVWGGLVPYGQVWRAGANENTTIQFSDAVSIEGQALAAGTYGLHMMPGPDSWEIIFSKNSSSWGSFTYDKAEDALRVTVKPQPGEMREALSYDFDDVKPESAVITLRWEKLAVPFRVSANEVKPTLESLRRELRGGKQYTWVGWEEAAVYCLQHKTNLDEALHWSELSIQNEERFENLMTRSGLLGALNRTADAKASHDRAMEIGNVTQIYFFGRQLQAQNRQPEALETFRLVSKRFPNHWISNLAQARVDSAGGNFDDAAKHLETALTMGVPDQSKAAVETYLKRVQAKQDFNR
ncbi:MAG TPA: DUF2911 domain-containing protein [Candidatus Sulfopaludibacter sp.]|jgi:tetratricopeptide (TPR) repeat protein|nr:DUF2911 domain-containing protein [Candidatus Sulfopaludibacter sp.]